MLGSLELYDIPVTSLTSYGAKHNWPFYGLCQAQGSGKLLYKCANTYREDVELYFFCDAPHLLKTARNCFSNSFSHSKSRKMQVCFVHINCVFKIIFTFFLIRKRDKQLSIESLYLTETSTRTMSVRLCHKVTRDHIWLTSYSRMRVYLAAQVSPKCSSPTC